MIAKWINANNSNEENQSIFNTLFSQISAMEHARRKSELMKANYQKESIRYQEYKEELEANINVIKNAIDSSKVLLLEVRSSKQQKLNYDLIAKDISLEPSRAETSECVKELQNGLLKMKKNDTNLKKEWSIWRKHCSVIVTTANQLNSIIDKMKFE